MHEAILVVPDFAALTLLQSQRLLLSQREQ